MTLDAVVVGGGAAGIAAARTLHDAGRDILLLEASDRLGGRARSFVHEGQAFDLGSGWLHSGGRNPWTRIAEAAGFTVERTSPNWDEQWRDLGFPPAEQAAFGRVWAAFDAACETAQDGPDRALGTLISAEDRWRPLMDAMSGYINGAPLDRVSLHDYLAYEDAATDDNWSVREGYATVIVDHARGLPARLSTPVRGIDHRATPIRVETDDGTIEARAVIVAVPTSVLADGDIAFDPPLPAKRDAAAALPLGIADKAFLAVDRPEWPAGAHLIGATDRAATASHRLSPFGAPVIESFLGGDLADALEDDRAACAFAIDELVALLGSGWRGRLTPITASRWRHDPHIRGSYSHARVGRAPARVALGEPIDDRLLFAGEACSRNDFSTAHGAYATGVAAARAVLGRAAICHAAPHRE